mmetsp:Transcript_18699/g.51317  ORF Transcript_18699/g.51317 Transcript_18699/m.51317 type:complete len:266 (+) Transcript_18699:81-878(+)
MPVRTMSMPAVSMPGMATAAAACAGYDFASQHAYGFKASSSSTAPPVLSTEVVCSYMGPGQRTFLYSAPRFSGVPADAQAHVDFAAAADVAAIYQPGALLTRSASPGPATMQAIRSVGQSAPPVHVVRVADATLKAPQHVAKMHHDMDAEAESSVCSTMDPDEASLAMGPVDETAFVATMPPAMPMPGIGSSMFSGVLGSPEVPTVGSQGHIFGNCKPCAFVYKGGCASGVECKFCHLCPPGEKKQRKKERKAVRRCMLTRPVTW